MGCGWVSFFDGILRLRQIVPAFAQLFGLLTKILHLRLRYTRHFKLLAADIAELEGIGILDNKVERRIGVPWRLHAPGKGLRLEAVSFQRDVVSPIVGERQIDGGEADRLTVDVDLGRRGIGVDDEAPFHAARNEPEDAHYYTPIPAAAHDAPDAGTDFVLP